MNDGLYAKCLIWSGFPAGLVNFEPNFFTSLIRFYSAVIKTPKELYSDFETGAVPALSTVVKSITFQPK